MFGPGDPSGTREVPWAKNAELLIKPDEVIADLQWLTFECSRRCMNDTVAWAAEILAHCDDAMYQAFEASDLVLVVPPHPHEVIAENRYILLGRALMNTKELDRASYFFGKAKDRDEGARFLHYWARYLAILQLRLTEEGAIYEKRLALPNDQAQPVDDKQRGLYVGTLEDLHRTLLQELELPKLATKKKQEPPEADIFMEYLLGRVEATLGQFDTAWNRFANCIRREKRFWPAYEAIYKNSQGERHLKELINQFNESKQTYWLQNLFEMYALGKLGLFQESLQSAIGLLSSGLPNQPTLIQHIAFCHHDLYENIEAQEQYENVLKLDPARIHGMENYANSLFVLNMPSTLYQLLARFWGQRFKWEHCMITGNFHALRSDHFKAIRAFERAVRLNPFNSRPWTLIGHEYMELKMHPAAAMAYRRASELSPHDPAPFYGLATLYDIVKIYSHSLRYYKMAFNLRPYDSRMLVGLGEAFSKVGSFDEAKRCFMKAFLNGDVEGTALFLLGRVNERTGPIEETAKAYEKYLNAFGSIADEKDVHYVLRFLSNYSFERQNWQAAKFYAMLCMDHEETRPDGQKMLNDLSNVNGETEHAKMADQSTRHDVDTSQGTMDVADGDESLEFDD
ncbi:unnamed protein product, partial [Mesorhabditis spiculigera]